MNNRLLLGTYWYDRKETILTASEKIYLLFNGLSTIDSRFGRFKFVSTKKLDKILDISKGRDEYIQQLANNILETNRADIKHYHPRVILDLNFHERIGFVISFESIDIKGIQVSTIIGGYEKDFGMNTFIMRFPESFEYDYTIINLVFKEIVNKVKPSWGVVVNRGFLDNISRQTLPDIFVGWMNYFGKDIIGKDLDKIRKEVFNKGVFTYTTNEGEIFSITNQRHIANSFNLINYLKKKKITREIFKM